MNRQLLTLLLSDSKDYVSDLIVRRVGSARVFRYNVDLWRDYALRVSGDVIEITNPQGWRIDDSQIVKNLLIQLAKV